MMVICEFPLFVPQHRIPKLSVVTVNDYFAAKKFDTKYPLGSGVNSQTYTIASFDLVMMKRRFFLGNARSHFIKYVTTLL